MRRWAKTAIVLMVVLPVHIVRSDDKDVEERGIISIVEFIEVSQGVFSAHISTNPLKSDATDFRKAVQVWVKSEKAKIRDTLIVNTLSGQSGKSQAVHEIIYPGVFSPPLQTPKIKETDNESEAKTETPVITLAPIEFRTREVGGILEVAPVFNDDGTITVNIHPEFSARLESNLWEVQANGKSAKVETPTFHSTDVSTKVILKNGGYAFLGTSSLSDERSSEDFEDSILLIFLRADSF